MGESKNLHFYDFGIWGRVPAPQNQYYLSLEARGDFKKAKINQTHFWKTPYIFHIFQNVGNCKIGKSWAPRNLDDPFNKILKIMDMGSIFSRKHEMEIWYISLKWRKQETLKPRNQKPRNFESKKPKNQETKNPLTPQHTDPHPCTRPPSLGTRGSLGETKTW